MDQEDLRSLLRESGVDLWTLIDAAILVAARDHGEELRGRRDGIVERLYARGQSLQTPQRCRTCDPDVDPCELGGRDRLLRSNGREEEKGSSSPVGKGAASRSPPTPQSMNREERVEEEEEEEEEEEQAEEDDGRRINGVPIDDAKSKILAIKEFLDDEDQSEDSLVSLLQNLVDLDVTFKALKETDIGRHVNGLRKHPSAEVRRLVKLIVRKWKEIVDEWVKSNSENASPANITDGDSPLLIHGKSNEIGRQVPDFGYSPNPHNGSSEPVEPKAKTAVVARREVAAPPPKQSPSVPNSASPAKAKEQKDSLLDPERLASARRRLHENYQEAQNAKKQRTIQVMDINEIPKPKNSFMGRNRGGSHHQAKHW